MTHRSLDWIDDALRGREDAGLRRRLRIRNGRQGPRVLLDGRALLNLASNDYLGLAGHEALARAAARAAEQDGWGSGASPLIAGRQSEHAALEREIARFEGTEAAMLFPSGFAANAGTIPALVGTSDLVLSDARNHASIIDGCRLSGARITVYRHHDLDDLHARLQDAGGYRRRLIVTDGLFSMDGDVAPLDRIAEMAEAADAMLMVDEAHATGVLGARGRGASEWRGAEEGVAVRVGTLSKALGSAGGFVAGSQPLIDWLVNMARPYVYSTAPPPPLAAAGREALRLVQAEPQRRQTLLARAAAVRGALREQGWDVEDAPSQIVPLRVGDAGRAMRLAAQLLERGFFVPGIRPPSVPPGESMLRISLSCDHDPQQLEAFLTAVSELS